ncbi:AHH domain-containing protein [Archangium violaceum]|uniref:AHH domain-containing protein n=1 Tax=Archangium violaceum TaxID=83451 RepID=UPI002B2956C4|nr:AHH domain-containing protein [Archangium gephyra]
MRDEVEPVVAERSCGEPEHAREVEPPAAAVRIEALPQARVQLHFPPIGADVSLQRFTREDARRILQLFHEEMATLEESTRRVAAAGMVPVFAREASAVEGLLLKQYTERYGEPAMPLPDFILESPLAMALRLSPRYMPEGIREGWDELVHDPAFLAGLVVSLGTYVVAWAAPEPIFTKAFAASVTVVLVSAFTLTELVHAGGVALKLYQATRHAGTLGELEDAARNFGQYAGGAALRIMVAAASFGVTKLLPKPTPGGLGRTWAGMKDLLRLPQRFALPAGGQFVEAGAARSVGVGVKQGVLLMAGVAAGGTGASLRSACADGIFSLLGYSWHHLATNKNTISDTRGGPWTPVFERIFSKAGMTLDDPANKIYLLNHAGPHSEEYHREIFRRLDRVIRTCPTKSACRTGLMRELNKIADEICTPGSKLNRLATQP